MYGTTRPRDCGRPLTGHGRGAAPWLLALCMASLLALPRAAHAQAADDGSSSMVAKVIAGILSYTRWPTAAPSIRLCAVGRGPGVDALLRVTDLGSPGRSVTVTPAASLGAAGPGCDAVYIGHARNADARAAVRQFAGRPVLVVGEGPEFCSDGGMFCVDPAADVPRFGVNLDAVARSGLRVNPQVLRIARGGDGQGS
jgi:hypothetical protein